MQIPKIDRSKRSREYNLYTRQQHAAVVKAYVFDGMSHRQIDATVLNVDAGYSRGYQAMSILHHVGLKNSFKGIFKGLSPEQVILELQSKHDTSYDELISILQYNEINMQDIVNDIAMETAQEYAIEREGQPMQVYTNRYERSCTLRKKAIGIHGTRCMACGFDFFRVYGERGKGYIEVHHINPLATTKETDISAEKDLVVVCANCHRMIHRKRNEILTLEELRKLIHSNQQKY